jgi:hypothetical protein
LSQQFNMEDSTSETLQCQRRRDEEYVRDNILDGYSLTLDKNSMLCILKIVDSFLSQSRGNKSVNQVVIYSCSSYGYGVDDEVWYKVGQAIGNLQALKRVMIDNRFLDGGYFNVEQELIVPDWEILARILSQVRQKIEVNTTMSRFWRVEESRLFARAIHGHPTITSFDSSGNFPYESLGALYSALATLPALEMLQLSDRGRQTRLEDESHHESLTELLRIPSLRSVCFDLCSFTPALCLAIASAIMEGSAVTSLEFKRCSFSTVQCAVIMANGLGRNTSVLYITVESPKDGVLYNALAAALPSNSTLRDLWLSSRISDDDITDLSYDLSLLLLALGKNAGLKTLTFSGLFGSIGESLSTAMKDGLGTNETLESLEINDCLCDDNSAMWCRALSFLRTNKTLKSLLLHENRWSPTESYAGAAFRTDMVAMLQENASLERLSILTSLRMHRIEIKAEDYLALVTVLQQNQTLKCLTLASPNSLTLTHDEHMQLAALLKKNYALEKLSDIKSKCWATDADAILRLNKAGRRYLVEDGSSISKGVEVLSAVCNEIKCVFLHLLENPRLCDRSAVERVSTEESNNSKTANPSAFSAGRKREQASAHDVKESRRRLA